jgi:putative FmdB family regulatory protein
MPIYEYRCFACGHHLEALQKMSEGPLRKCPDCGKSQLRRLVSASRFRLKGSGWYETDFKNKDDKQRNLVDKATPADGEKKSDGATDAGAKDEAAKVVTAAKAGAAAPNTDKPNTDKPNTDKPKAASTKTSRSARKKAPAKAKAART